MNVEGNEVADKLARKGSASSLNWPELFCGVGPGLLNIYLKKGRQKFCKEITTLVDSRKL